MTFDQWVQLAILAVTIGVPLGAMHRQNLIRGHELMHEVKRLTALTEQHDQRTRKVRRRLKRLERRIFGQPAGKMPDERERPLFLGGDP